MSTIKLHTDAGDATVTLDGQRVYVSLPPAAGSDLPCVVELDYYNIREVVAELSHEYSHTTEEN